MGHNKVKMGVKNFKICNLNHPYNKARKRIYVWPNINHQVHNMINNHITNDNTGSTNPNILQIVTIVVKHAEMGKEYKRLKNVFHIPASMQTVPINSLLHT